MSKIVGFDLCDPGAIDPDGDGVLDGPVYFTLATGSPSLASIGVNESDILRSRVGASGSPTLFIAGSSLGLVSGDVIDALATNGAATFFSLALQSLQPRHHSTE